MTRTEFEQRYECSFDKCVSGSDVAAVEQMLFDKGLSEGDAQFVRSYLDDPTGQSTPEEHMDWMLEADEEELKSWIAHFDR